MTLLAVFCFLHFSLLSVAFRSLQEQYISLKELCQLFFVLLKNFFIDFINYYGKIELRIKGRRLKYMTIRERVKELRKSILGLSMEAFGEKLGVAKNTVSQWESGKNTISEATLKSICREYNVNYFWLTEGDGEPFVDLPETTLDELCVEYELDAYEKSIIFEYLKLSKEEKSVIKKYISNIKKEH